MNRYKHGHRYSMASRKVKHKNIGSNMAPDQGQFTSKRFTDTRLKRPGLPSAHGRPGPSHGQHFYRTALVDSKISFTCMHLTAEADCVPVWGNGLSFTTAGVLTGGLTT